MFRSRRALLALTVGVAVATATPSPAAAGDCASYPHKPKEVKEGILRFSATALCTSTVDLLHVKVCAQLKYLADGKWHNLAGGCVTKSGADKKAMAVSSEQGCIEGRWYRSRSQTWWVDDDWFGAEMFMKPSAPKKC